MEMGPLFTSVFGLRSPVLAQAPLAILCIHGVEAHGLRYLRLAELLPEATVLAPDLRGHGRSPKHGPYTVDQHVRDLAPLLRRIAPRAVVLGHSFGGLLAWELARYAHDQLRGLILVDPAIGVGADFAGRQASIVGDGQHWPTAAKAFAAMMAGRPPVAAWSVALDVAVGLEREPGGGLRQRFAPEAVREAWREMAEPLRDSSYRGPTLVIEAGHESGTYVRPATLADLRDQLGDRLEHVRLDTAHTITSDAPELLADQVTAFLGRLG